MKPVAYQQTAETEEEYVVDVFNVHPTPGGGRTYRMGDGKTTLSRRWFDRRYGPSVEVKESEA